MKYRKKNHDTRCVESVARVGLAASVAPGTKEEDPVCEITDIDANLILTQCRNQGATSDNEIKNFTAAYRLAKESTFIGHTADSNERFIRTMAFMIDPRNDDYRRIPVTFKNGSQGLNPGVISRAMRNLSTILDDLAFASTYIYHELELIHPFLDGNGRLGHLVWAIAVKDRTGTWPEQLPPKLFQS